MAWNEPGKPGQDPWGNSNPNGSKQPEEPRKPNKPRNQKNNDPDLDELLRKVQNLFGGAKNSMDDNSFFGRIGISVILLVVFTLWMLSGIYIVDSPERGVVKRFGAFVEETTAGPHWHIPYPIESVTKVNVDRIRTAEIGYRSDVRNKTGSVASESLMLSKDENIVDIRIAVQYKVQSANQYLFEVSDPDISLRAVTESALREVVGQNKMDFVLTEGRNEVVSRVREVAQANLDLYRTGLIITSVNLQDAQPPEQVQSAFADVVKAREDKERLINEAQAYSNDILPKARGQAARQMEEASAYHAQVIAVATGKASRFDSIVSEYQKSPVVTRQRLYMDAIGDVLGKTSKVFVGSESGTNLLYLPLDKMMSGAASQVPFKGAAELDVQAAAEAAAANSGSAAGSQRTNIRDYLRTREIR